LTIDARAPGAVASLASLALAAGLSAACGGGGGGETPDASPPDATVYTGLSEIEAVHYDYQFDMAKVCATTDVQLMAVTAGDCLEIGFRPDAATAVFINDEPAIDIQTANDRLHACDATGRGWPAGASVELTVMASVPFETWADSQVGYSVTNDREGNPYSYLVSWVGGCDRHGPCDARPDRFPTYRFSVINYPAGTKVLCSGAVTETDNMTTCDFPLDGGPTYSTFSFMAGQSWTTTSLGMWGDTAVTLYDYPSSGIAAALDTDTISAHFAFMEDTFGPYPYGDELRFAVGPTYWAGFEHPGNISLSEYLTNGSAYYTNQLTHTTMHEVTHQWAGDQTTLAGTYDFVWKESMAEYITSLSERDLQGDVVADATARAWKSFALGSYFFPVPDEQPALFDYYGDVYGEGPMILFRQLEVIFGRPAIINALVMLIGTNSAHAIGISDVKAALEVATGADLTAYFDGWVYGSGRPAWPRASATWVPGSAPGSYDVTINVTTSDGVGRGCVFDVRLQGATPTEIYDIAVDTGLDGTLTTGGGTVTPGFVPTSYTVDPGAKCLVWKSSTGAAPAPRINPWVIAR
jgi:aminopeptidase N